MMEEGGSSATMVVLTSQLGWLARFILALGVFGALVWYLKRVLGLDLEKDVNSLEKLLEEAAKERNVWLAMPFTAITVSVILVVGSVVAGFVD